MSAQTLTVTLLFTDLVNSTEVALRLGAESHDLRRAHDRILREQFDTHNGTVVKNTGDGFFVTFSSARDAVECAAAVQRAIATQQLEGRYPDLAVRMGLHTGEPEFDDGDYFGVDVAVASRIMDQAHGGDVLLSETTYLLARSAGQLQFDPGGSRQLKGLPEATPLYRLRWDLQPAQSHLSRFVGRTVERSRMRAQLDGVRHGKGSLLLVSGEGGLGKTRLAAELCIEARDKGMVVLTGRAFDTEGLPPYHAVTDAIRAHLRRRPAPELRTLLQHDAPILKKVLPELDDDGLPERAEPIVTMPEAERYQLFEAITRLLVRIVEVTPGVLFVDDLHWADRATVNLIEHIARRASDSPLLILGTYRDSEVPQNHPLTALAREIERSSTSERIALTPLSRDDAVNLAADILGEPLPPNVADELYAASEGSPFFMEELVRHMRDHPEDGAAPAASWQMPESVRHMLLRRLDGLSTGARELVETCAVMGVALTVARIAAATERSPEAVAESLDEAVESRVLQEEHDGYSFTHPLIREVVYQALRASERRRIHRRVATGLERLYQPEIELHVAELAHHYLQSSHDADLETAVAYARRAAAKAAAVFAYDEAAAYYRRAADAVKSAGSLSAERCALLLALGDMQTKAGDAPGADASFHLAASVARDLGRADLLANAALGLGDVRRTGGVVDAPLIALLDEAHRSLDPGDSTLRARVLARLTAAQYLARPLHELQRQARDATEMAERLGDDAAKVYVWRTVRLFRHEQHDVIARLRDARELESLTLRLGDREATLYARHMQIDALVELGEIREADALIAAFEHEAESLRQPFYLWLAAVYRGMRALMDAHWDEAEDLAQRAFAIGREAQTQNNLALQFLAAQLFAVRLEQGRLDELAETMREFARQNEAVRWQVGIAFLLSEIDEDAAARADFEAIVGSDAVDVPDDFNQSMLLVFLAELCDRFDDVRRARAVYERLLPFEGRNVVVGAPATCAGSASRLLGLLAGVLARWDDAERHLADALAMNARLGSRSLVAWTQYACASTLLRRRRPGDVQRAEEILDEAGRTADELGMTRLSQRIANSRISSVPPS